ncbi:hypothetical protein JKP88DRAFT_245195 [Tribonema minus]|uniref:Uncharacterized protein n=1 Tax=Tribonema minus TaxID=303371 RepID=A0A835YXI5_9STRA|nr:hypothetical protein JKP88DRAFT_245195 [Tribonema minus]
MARSGCAWRKGDDCSDQVAPAQSGATLRACAEAIRGSRQELLPVRQSHYGATVTVAARTLPSAAQPHTRVTVTGSHNKANAKTNAHFNSQAHGKAYSSCNFKGANDKALSQAVRIADRQADCGADTKAYCHANHHNHSVNATHVQTNAGSTYPQALSSAHSKSDSCANYQSHCGTHQQAYKGANS